MGRVLVITSRNIITTCGELRLIKNRSIALEQYFGIGTDYIAYRLRKPQNEKFEKLNGSLTVFRDPYDRRKIKADVSKRLHDKDYSCVILSGPFVYFLIPTIRKINTDIKIILDLHGTIEELKEFKKGSKIKNLAFILIYEYMKMLNSKYEGKCDGFLAVSRSLAKEAERTANKKVRTFIVPCAVKGYISYDEYIENRKKYREKYGIKDDETVFIYSGGNSPWQCVDESIKLFDDISRQHAGCRMVVFTGSEELVKKVTKNNNIIVDSLSPDKVAETLCMGDFGLMLRADYKTNNAAFPNKFLEYVISGLRVIATPYVYDVKGYIEKYKIGTVINTMDDAHKIISEIDTAYSMKDHFERRNMLLDETDFKNTLRPFVEYVER